MTMTHFRPVPGLILLLLFGLAVSPTRAQVAPDPLPDFATLTPDDTHQVLYDVADVAGNFMMHYGDVAYIWDLALVKHPDGDVATLRYELQTEDDYQFFESDLSDHPAGSVEIQSLSQVFTTGSYATILWILDEDGYLRGVQANAIQSGTISVGGGLGGGSGPIVGISTCARQDLHLPCSDKFACQSCVQNQQGCHCADWGFCGKVFAGWGCNGGTCSTGKTCQNDNAGGCGCQ